MMILLQDVKSRETLYLLASHLPRASVEPIARGSLQALASIRQLSSKTHDHTHLLVALLSWKQSDDVVKLANQWLTPSFNGVGGGDEKKEAEPKDSRRCQGKVCLGWGENSRCRSLLSFL